MNAAGQEYRLQLDGNEVRIDESWHYGGFLSPGQTGSTSVVVLGDWVAFQTNGTPATAPMTVHVISQANPSVATKLTPFSFLGTSFTPSSLSGDPATLYIYVADGGRGQIAKLGFDPEMVELSQSWLINQRTLNHLTFIGPPEARVLVGTDAPNAVIGLLGGRPYDEQVVWRSAETGAELARSEVFPELFCGGPVNPGFDGTQSYLGMDGGIRQSSTAPAEATVPVCGECRDHQ